MSKQEKLHDKFLMKLVEGQHPVSVFLVNGIKLQGKIEAFDDDVLVLSNVIRQMVFKHAISTVVPSVNIDIN